MPQSNVAVNQYNICSASSLPRVTVGKWRLNLRFWISWLENIP